MLQSLRKNPLNSQLFLLAFITLYPHSQGIQLTLRFILTIHSCIYWVTVNNIVILLHTQM